MASQPRSAGERLPMAGATEALVVSARLAAVPGLLWIAGAVYPSLNLNVDLFRALLGLAETYTGIDLWGEGRTGLVVALFAPESRVVEWSDSPVLFVLVGIPLLLLLSRLTVGLARVSDPRLSEPSERARATALESGILTLADVRQGRPVRLRAAWRAGRGLALEAIGLWLVLIGLLLGAALLVLGPVYALVRWLGVEELSAVFAGLLTVPMLLLLAYAVVLMVLNQLALHSLAHNRRGVSSALTHAWRLVKASPRGAARATLLDVVLAVSIVAVDAVLSAVLGVLPGFGALAGPVLFLLYGFAGVTRAGFWGRTYRALGGMSAGDQVPGL